MPALFADHCGACGTLGDRQAMKDVAPAPATGQPTNGGSRPLPDLPRAVLGIGAMLLLGGGSLYILLPFVPALIWSIMIVVATWPVFLRLQRALGGHRGAAVCVMLLVQIVVIVIPVYGAVSTLADHAAEIMAFVKGLPTYALPSPPRWLGAIPVIGERIAHEWQTLSDAGPGGALARIQPYIVDGARWMLAHVSLLGVFVLHLLLMIIVCGLLYAKGETAAQLVTRVAQRISPHYGADIIRLMGLAIRAIALGIVVTAVVQASLAAAGVWVAGIPFAGVLSALLLLACLVQIGPLLPLLGCVAWLYSHDSNVAAVLLLVWTIGVSMLDNILRPILIRRAVALPMVLILAGVLGGVLSIGVAGLFIGPVVLAVTYHLLLAWVGLPDASTAQGGDRQITDAGPTTDPTDNPDNVARN